MKIDKLLVLFFLPFLNLPIFSQCTGVESISYQPHTTLVGTEILFCYEMDGYNMIDANFIEGFQIEMSPSLSNLTPINPPQRCYNGTIGGNWIWSEISTSSITGVSAGPGWFFDYIPDGNAGNDWGDVGDTCVWSFCFTVTVVDTCQPLIVIISAGPDGLWGGWTYDVCNVTPFTTYLGISQLELNSTDTVVYIGDQINYDPHIIEIDGGGSFLDYNTVRWDSSGQWKVSVLDYCYNNDLLQRVTVEEDVFIPNAFTPNGDGVNDVFIVNTTQNNTKLEIFNRWGQLVSQNPNSWDGGNNPTGVYSYKFFSKNRVNSGYVTLVR